MSVLAKLPQLLEEGRMCYESGFSNADFMVSETIGDGVNMLARGDNLAFMQYLTKECQLSGKLNLVYIDPPFFSKANYGAEIKLKSENLNKLPIMKQKAYHDTWSDGMEDYLRMLIPRLFMIRDLLTEDGCLWVHLDWHSVHYVKIILDEIFGEKNFANEVIWNYKSGGVSKRYFARKHDTLLFYGKTPSYYFKPQQEKSYNRDLKPYKFKGVKEYRDEMGWYTLVNMKDVWQLNMVGRTSAERTGYATQKPEQLIERILESCTREGDLCADFFGGSGTLAAAADKMNRKWISCDIGKLAVVNAHKRMAPNSLKGYRLFEDAAQKNEAIVDITLDIEQLDISDKVKLILRLKSYKPTSLEAMDVEEKFMPVLKEIIEQDSLQFIDYWSIDFHYDGINFNPAQYFCKGNDGIPLSCERLANCNQRVNIGIRVIDIFGNSTFVVKKI